MEEIGQRRTAEGCGGEEEIGEQEERRGGQGKLKEVSRRSRGVKEGEGYAEKKRRKYV